MAAASYFFESASWGDVEKCAALLEGLSKETCSLSLTVLLRIGRRMEAITSASSRESAKPLHINQHYSTATPLCVCMSRSGVKEHPPVVAVPTAPGPVRIVSQPQSAQGS